MSEHPNAATTRLGFEAFSRGDAAALAALIAPDAEWRICGGSALAGTHAGREAIFALFRRTAELSGGTYRVEPLWVVADDEHVVVVYRARGEREGRSLDIQQALIARVEDGAWVEVDAVPFDQRAFDAFWAEAETFSGS